METIVNLIIQLIAGVVGGNAAGAALKDYNLGNLGNTIAGAIGGVGGGQLLQAIIPAIASASTGVGWAAEDLRTADQRAACNWAVRSAICLR